MSNYLVTGARNNTPHITSMDDASLNAGIIGNGAYILNRGEKLRAEMTTANNCRIYDGDLVAQGRHVRIETSEYIDLTVNNGTVGIKRNDLVVARYTNDVETGVESVDFVVIEGTPSATPSDPEYNVGNIFDGDLVVDFPLYRIQLDGITASAPELLTTQLGSGFIPEGTNNCCKLPDGTMLQWGTGEAPITNSQPITIEIPYPFPFKSVHYLFPIALTSYPDAFNVSEKPGGTGSKGLIAAYCNRSGFSSIFYDWIAIGRWK